MKILLTRCGIGFTLVHRRSSSNCQWSSQYMIVLSTRLAMILLLFLALSPHLAFSYNVDTASPIVYEDPDPDSNRSNYFGYSVALAWTGNASSAPPLFVGAPESSNGTGSVYRCGRPSTRDQQTSRCHQLKIKKSKISKTAWLGASMAVGKDSDLTVCAPLSITRHRIPSRLSTEFFLFEDLYGACYNASGTTVDVLYRDDGDRVNPSEKLVERGFSINYYAPRSLEPSNGRSGNVIRIIGLPGLNGVEVKHNSKKYSDTAYVDNNPLNIGHSVSVGYYRGTDQYYVAAGAPSVSKKGMVVIFSPGNRRLNRKRIDGTYLGEYFGASLATGDFDNDGHDDLAIGAPHWGDGDFGRVYTYRFDRNGEPKGKVRTLQGNVVKGQFGYTLASADLDADGFADLVVSAPWENSGAGAVYIYYGHRDFNREDPPAQIVQRIEPSAFGRNDEIQRFGFALSQPVDIDGNGYPDLAIGAYKSGHAVVLRSRLVIKTTIDLVTYPETLLQSTKDFIVAVCVTYEGRRAPESLDLSFNMTVDAKHNRAENKTFTNLDALFFRHNRTCVNTTIPLAVKPGSSALDPIKIKVTSSFKKDVNKREIDPVLNRTSSDTKELTLYFQTGCEGGRICNAQLFLDASLGGISREDNSWVVGSGDVSLNVMVRNEKEPAYVARITIGIPPGIHLRKNTEFCSIAMDALSLTCDIGNPLVKGTPKALNIEFDMSEISMKLIGVPGLTFNVTKSTRSNDEEARSSTTILTLNTKHDADVTLTVVTGKQHIRYGRISENTEIPIQHAYQVHKSGPSPITEAYLTIDVPTSMFGKNVSFLNINDAKLIDDSGDTHNCYVTGSRSGNDLLRRNRRDNSAGSDETFVTSKSTATEGTPNDLSSTPNENMIVGDRVTELRIYLNCSTEGVSCTRLNCSFEFSNSQEGFGNMVLNMNFNATSFHTSDEDALSYIIHTNASVDIQWPSISNSDHIRIWTANATTILHNIPEPKKPALWWILPTSIVCGILLVFILAGILYKTGFFSRSMKLKVAKAKEQKLILESNKADLDDVDLDGDGDAATDADDHHDA